MPRPLRIEINNGWYHVMNRGAARKNIFKTDKQRLIFLDLLAEAVGLFDIKTHAYCLMDNHYHLLIHTPRGNLSRAMRHINGLYTQKFNRLEKRDGSLFRGRYKAILVDKDNYLLQVSRYIHDNPVAAKMCVASHHYKWSSSQYYCGNNKVPAWLDVREILSMMNHRNKKQAYKEFMGEEVDKIISDFYKKEYTSTILGDKPFKEMHLKGLSDSQIEAYKADYNRTLEVPLMDEINAACIRYFKISEEELYKSKRGETNNYRKIGMYACRQWGFETLQNIAKKYECRSQANIGKLIKSVKQQMKDDKKMREVIRGFEKIVLSKFG